MTKDYPWGKGTPTWVRDATANDSDKSFTVPAGKVWDLSFVEGYMACTATVGNRSLRIWIYSEAALTNSMYTGVSITLTASQTGVVAFTSRGIYSTSRTKANNAGSIDSLGDIRLPAGYTIRVWDANAVDAAADDLTVALHYVEYDA